METKHGLSQGRLNSAKDYTRIFLESVNRIEWMEKKLRILLQDI